jgi:hypothetical protein
MGVVWYSVIIGWRGAGPNHNGKVEFQIRKHHTYRMVGFI